jgi:cytochrome oxidase Cu insertion factor (SCO1/SenC/PrrC family)
MFACMAAWSAPTLGALRGTFVDEQGRAGELAQWLGRPTVVAMEYSECRFVCSLAWRRLAEIQAEADRRGLKLQFLIISIDPENDTPALWRAYRQERGLTLDNWRFVTGDRAATDRVAALLGVRWWRSEGHIIHDLRITRLDALGRTVGTLDNLSQSAAQFLAP